jgi:hypothetical protein
MVVVQELHEHDLGNRVACAQNLLEIVADDAASGMNDEATSTYLSVLANRISVTGQTQTHSSFMNAVFTLIV